MTIDALEAVRLGDTTQWIRVRGRDVSSPVLLLMQLGPGEAAKRFYDSVAAPRKELVWFERSAHTPHFEEPEKFREVLMAVRCPQAR
jgi:pimeloyl-ACP methyl ester carboxylesterase